MRYSGTVIHGDAYGRTLGYPTANLDLNPTKYFESGVYAASVWYKDSQYQAALMIDTDKKRVELYLFDFDGDLYGEELSFEVHKKVNDMKHCDSEQALKEKIQSDIEKIQLFFA